ncbi:MAG TPA: AbrB/MazE/SpoVT family DNA-binding domain-containing protein [Thermoanaerobaculia bacterium]|jgi:bifunctional DNA-binding transcriptional regulator/antitoxin component of YhaV-PrlF toxin-antitoxin module
MTKSRITVKYQTTVPKEVREQLGVGPSDVLQWEVLGDHARVTVSGRAFLELRGSFKVGPGDPVEDVRRARELMGTEGA